MDAQSIQKFPGSRNPYADFLLRIMQKVFEPIFGGWWIAVAGALVLGFILWLALKGFFDNTPRRPPD